MTTAFELAKRMLYSGERIAAPLHYLALFAKLTPTEQGFLIRESESIGLAPNPEKEGKRRLCNGRQRRPGGGRKELGTRPEYVAAMERSVTLQSLESPLPYSTQSARSIAAEMKRHGHSCNPASIPKLAAAAGMRIHPRVKPSPRIKTIAPADQFSFIAGRLDHVLSRDTGLALYITTDPLPKTPYNCPTDRLESWRGHALADYVQKVLMEREDEYTAQKIDEIVLIVEGGGLLGMRNRKFPRMLQLFADRTGITTYLSHLPPGLSRISADVLVEDTLPLTREHWKLGTIHIRIGNVKPALLPFNPRDGKFRSTSWNHVFHSISFHPDPTDEIQTCSSRDDIQDAVVNV